MKPVIKRDTRFPRSRNRLHRKVLSKCKRKVKR